MGWSCATVDNDSFQFQSGTFVTTIKPGTEPWTALWSIFDFADQLIQKYKPNQVVLEKTSGFRASFITGQVSHCMGAILSACGKFNDKSEFVEFVYPTHVKKVVAEDGRAKKPKMKKAALDWMKHLNQNIVKFDSEHSADATANILCYLIEHNLVKGTPHG